ncbi:MAG: RcpC/CpaB family pilus assembly protein [Caldilineaceae bacterium]
MISETRKQGNRFMMIGLVLAAVSMLLVTRSISQIKASVAPLPTPTPELLTAAVYVAADIPAETRLLDALEPPKDQAGSPIQLQDVCPAGSGYKSALIGKLQVCAVPQRFVPPSTILLTQLTLPDLPNTELVRGALTERLSRDSVQLSLKRGNILQSSFTESNRAPAGMVEVGLGVNTVTSVGGRVRPGQRVDVVVSYEKKVGSDKQPTTEYLLQDVEVIAVPSGSLRFEELGAVQDTASSSAYAVLQEMQNRPRPLDNSVVLAVSPDAAAMLVHMANFAKEVHLLLRSPGDHTIHKIAPVSTQ